MTSQTPEWKQSEASKKMQLMTTATPKEREEALLEWRKFTTNSGRAEFIPPHSDRHALSLALSYIEHRQSMGGATAARAALELWAVDSHHQRMGLSNPFMVNEKVKSMIKKAVQDECQQNSRERRSELMEHEPTTSTRKLIAPAKYSQWLEKSSGCKDFSPLKSHNNPSTMFAVQDEPMLNSPVKSTRKPAFIHSHLPASTDTDVFIECRDTCARALTQALTTFSGHTSMDD